MPEGSKAPIVLDSGTGAVKCGFAGANFPTAVFPTILGRPVLRSGATKNKNPSAGSGAAAAAATGAPSSSTTASDVDELKDLMLGDEVTRFRHLLDISTPIRNGIVRKDKVNDMCLLWDYAFSSKLKVDPKEHPLSLSEAPISSDMARGQLFEIMFERFGVPAIQSTMQGILVLYATGDTTGLAVDSGDGVTHCTPIYEGYNIKKANRRVDVGGNDVTQNLVRLMMRRGYSFHSSADFELMRTVKEQFCYAAVDYKAEKQLAETTTVQEKSMVLPDNSVCTIGRERFEATECLFDPGLVQIECQGLSHQIWNAIQASDIDIRAALYGNVILAGGSTMFPGLPSRVEEDMRQMYLKHALRGDKSRLSKFPLNIRDPPRRKYMAFLGGSCYSQLTVDSEDCWMTKAQWDEGGASLAAQMFSMSY